LKLRNGGFSISRRLMNRKGGDKTFFCKTQSLGWRYKIVIKKITWINYHIDGNLELVSGYLTIPTSHLG
jgi:hypothetical protein